MIESHAIILAAGLGTRMHSSLPKCAHLVLGKPMIEHIYTACKEANIDDIVVVVGYKKEIIKGILKDSVRYAYQEEQLGTGHACKMAAPYLLDRNGNTIILPGDMPLIGSNRIKELINYHEKNNNQMTILSFKTDNPCGYGRIIRNSDNNVVDIVEEKDASDEQRKIKEVNSGLYIVDNNLLFHALSLLNNNNSKGEYYLTDIVAILAQNNKVGALLVDNDYRLTGVNDEITLKWLENQYKMVG